MNKPKKSRPAVKRKVSAAIFSARPEYAIICPICKTAQNRDRDRCSCGVLFIFLDETNRFC